MMLPRVEELYQPIMDYLYTETRNAVSVSKMEEVVHEYFFLPRVNETDQEEENEEDEQTQYQKGSYVLNSDGTVSIIKTNPEQKPKEKPKKRRELTRRIICACEDLVHATFIMPKGDGYCGTNVGLAISKYRDVIDRNLLRRIPSFVTYEEIGKEDDTYKKIRKKHPTELVPDDERLERTTKIDFDEVVDLRMRDTRLSNMLDAGVLYYEDKEIFVRQGVEIPQRELNIWKRKGKKNQQKMTFYRRNEQILCSGKTESSGKSNPDKGDTSSSDNKVKSRNSKKTPYGEKGSRNEKEIAKDLNYIRFGEQGGNSNSPGTPVDFKKAFLRVMKKCGFTQEELALKLHTSVSSLQRNLKSDYSHIPELDTLTKALISIDAPQALGEELMRKAGYNLDRRESPYVMYHFSIWQLFCTGMSLKTINEKCYKDNPLII